VQSINRINTERDNQSKESIQRETVKLKKPRGREAIKEKNQREE